MYIMHNARTGTHAHALYIYIIIYILHIYIYILYILYDVLLLKANMFVRNTWDSGIHKHDT
jgi:hypothetical protein